MEKIIKVQKDDYNKLASFLTSHWNFGEGYWLERFDFLWERNPAFTVDPVRGLLVKKNSKILGFLGNFPTLFQLNGKKSITANGFSFLLDPSLRGTGIGKELKRQHTVLSKGKLEIATTPNKISSNIIKAIGYQLIPRGIGNYNNYSLIPLNKPNSIKIYLHLLKQSKSIITMNSLKHNFTKLTHGKSKTQDHSEKDNDYFNTVRIESADTDFDELWEETKDQYQNTNIRNSEIVNWYLLPTKDANREIYATYIKKKLVGYIIVRITMFKRTRLLLCVDLWAETEDRKDIVRNLIAFSEKQAYTKCCDALLLPHFSKDLSMIYDDIGVGYQTIGPKRNDMFLTPNGIDCHLSEYNSYITYMNGDRFLSKETI